MVNQGLSLKRIKGGVVVPQVGGLLLLEKDKYEPFTGGSNLQGEYLIPMHAKQRRPICISDQEFLMKTLDAGLKLKLDSPDAPETASSVSVVHWFESLASTMELLGLDTVFCIPTTDWSDEHYLLKNWGQIDEALTKPWAQSL